MRVFIVIFALALVSCSNGPRFMGDNLKFNNDEFMSVKEMRELLKSKKERGEKLYGTAHTVFEGTKIESFQIDFVDVVLFGGFVKRPIYLARIVADSHPVVKKVGVAAGMSGSPIYVNGKLVGALAYGWGLQRDENNLIGVTPIEFMLEDTRENQIPRVAGRFNSNDSAFQPLPVPVSVSGLPIDKIKNKDMLKRFSPRRHKGFNLPEYEIIPMNASATSGVSIWTPPDKFEPGSFVGEQYVSGDIQFVGYGTVTYVKDDTIIAYGHPSSGVGECETPIPMVSGVVHTVIGRQTISYKMGAGGKILGAIVKDRDSGVTGKVGLEWANKVKMIPVTVNIKNTKEKVDQTVSVEIINHKGEFPFWLWAVSYLSSITFEPSWLRERVIISKAQIKLVGGKTLDFSNVYAESEFGWPVVGSLDDDLYYKTDELLNNPWQKVQIESVSISHEYINESGAKYLKEAWPVENEVEDGGDVTLKLALRKKYAQDEIREVKFKLPKGLKKGQEVVIRVGGGGFMYPEIPPYNDLDGLVQALQISYHNKDLIMETTVDATKFMYKGHTMDKFPLSAFAKLAPSLNEQALFGSITERKMTRQDLIILGSTSVRVRIK